MKNPSFITAPILGDIASISHGFFGKHGGVSTGQYTSLNTGYGSDDKPDDITENRKRVANTLGANPSHLLSVHQHHSTDVKIVTTPDNIWDNQNPPKADAIVTSIAGIACSALAADCAPVLFVDPKVRIIGAAHAGWRGALGGITDETIKAMLSLGAKRENICAAIGPCISQKHFEVGPEFVDLFMTEHSSAVSLFVEGKNYRSHFDIKTYLVRKLLRAGITQAEAFPACSYGQQTDYFSYRYNSHNGISDYGRNISAIMLKTDG